MNAAAIRDTAVLVPIWRDAKMEYDRRHSHRAAQNLRDATMYLLLAEIRARKG